MTRSPRNAGFSFIEILVVMLIMGILTGLAYLRFGPQFERSRVRAAANVIAADLQTAQVLAARESEPILFAVNASARTYTITTRAGDTVYVSRNMASGSDYEVDTLRTSVTSIQFFPNGITSGGATVTVASKSYRRSVTLSRAGQIRMNSGS